MGSDLSCWVGVLLYVSNNARCCSIRTVFLLIPTGVFSPSLRQSASVMDTADRLRYGTSFIIRPEWCVVGSHGVDATDISCQRDLMMMMTMMMCPVPRCLKRTRSSDFLCSAVFLARAFALACRPRYHFVRPRLCQCLSITLRCCV